MVTKQAIEKPRTTAEVVLSKIKKEELKIEIQASVLKMQVDDHDWSGAQQTIGKLIEIERHIQTNQEILALLS